MKRFRTHALVLLLGLPFITPFLKGTEVACTHDGHLHYHRVVAMKHAWQNGLYFTRWLPDLAFGYGYPFFLYREPVPLYLTLFPHLAGLPLPTAGNLFYAACILAGGLFMFLWVRDIFGERAGVVSAVAYMSAPYVLIDALIRGNQPESIALALFPLLLWAGRRYLLSGTRRWFAIAVLSLAFFSLSHNISLLLFTPFLGIYLLLIGRLHANALTWTTILTRLTLFFACGLGMTAFYPGSALLEMDAVTLSMSTTTRNNDFRFNFATLGEIFSPVSFSDPNLLNPPMLLRLGWVPVGLALLGCLKFFLGTGLGRGERLRFNAKAQRRKGEEEQEQLAVNSQQLTVNGGDGAQNLFSRHVPLAPCSLREATLHVWFMLVSAVVFIFLSLEGSFWLWENLPLIDFVQFPWRMVGRAALPVAFLAGVSLSDQFPVTSDQYVGSLVTGHWLLVTALALLFLETVPNLYPRICEEAPFPTILELFEYEHVTGLVGVDPEGSYFPTTVRTRPSGSPLEADYAAGRTPQRIDMGTMPVGATLDKVTYGNNRASFEITTPEPFTMRYFSFAFPGWRAEVNGEVVGIEPTRPDGLISFQIPAGTHTVEIAFWLTPARRILAIISLLFVVFFFVALVRVPTDNTDNTQWRADNGQQIFLRSLFATSLLLLLAKFTLLDLGFTPLRGPSANQFNREFENNLTAAELELMDAILPQQPIPTDQPVVIDLAWRANAVPAERYQTALTLIGPDGLRWSEKELFRPRIYEDMPDTVYWLPGNWSWDSWEISPLSAAPPGPYQIELTVFERETLTPLTLQQKEGGPLGTSTMIGTVELAPPTETPQVSPQYSLAQEIAPGLNLIGYNLDREQVQPREKMLITLFLEKTGPLTSDQDDIELAFVGDNRTETIFIRPGSEGNRPSDWPLGTVMRTQDFVPVPAAVDETEYMLQIEAGEPIALRPIEVIQIDRLFEPPLVGTELGQDWAEPIRLHGYTLNETEETLEVELIWQARGEIEAGYRVFVHGLDAAGEIVTQSDGVPAEWSRPTDGWIEGEYVVDPHRLTLPLDDEINAIRVGLYRPETGEQLSLINSTEKFSLIQLD